MPESQETFTVFAYKQPPVFRPGAAARERDEEEYSQVLTIAGGKDAN